MISGIVNVNKPSGPSSSAVVGAVRKALGTRTVGHMGTLDPMGEGVLLMGVGKGTRLFEYFLSKTKTYEATFRFGLSTDTDDISGTVTAETDKLPSVGEITEALRGFIGKQEQLPPIYSAKSVDGVRAYKLARGGQTPQLRPVEITVSAFDLVCQTGENEYLMRIDCSSGTYIRSLCRDLGERCGSLAIMTSIKRTRCGNFFLSDAISPENLTMSDIIPLEKAVSDMQSYILPDDMYKKAVNGVPIEVDSPPSGYFTLFCRGELLGIAQNTPRGIKLKTYLKED